MNSKGMNESKNKTKHERKPVPVVAAFAPAAAAAGQYFWNHFPQISFTRHVDYTNQDSYAHIHTNLQVAAAAAKAILLESAVSFSHARLLAQASV